MKHTIYVIPGTGDVRYAKDGKTPIGILAPYGHRLDPDVFDVKFIDYPATFGAPSYVKSRDAGVEEVKRLIRETPGTFGLVGFSQGGAVADLVVRDLVEGDLQDRHADCLWAHVFASPHRAKGKTFHLDDPHRLRFGGIAGDPVENTGVIDYFAYAVPDDVFTHCDLEGTYGDEIYRAIKHSDFNTPEELFRVYSNVSSLFRILPRTAIRDIRRILATLDALQRLLFTGAHQFYFNPAHTYFNGMTAMDHSLNHLNYWGRIIQEERRG